MLYILQRFREGKEISIGADYGRTSRCKKTKKKSRILQIQMRAHYGERKTLLSFNWPDVFWASFMSFCVVVRKLGHLSMAMCVVISFNRRVLDRNTTNCIFKIGTYCDSRRERARTRAITRVDLHLFLPSEKSPSSVDLLQSKIAAISPPSSSRSFSAVDMGPAAPV